MGRQIEVSDETYAKIKEMVEEEEKKKAEPITKYEDMISRNFFFRTVTYHLVGKVVRVIKDKFLELEEASWVADSGRFGNAIKNGTLNEVEYVGSVFVNMDSVTDFLPWVNPLPNKTK